MSKKGRTRPDWPNDQMKNNVPPVPVIQGKAKHGKEHVRPIIAGTDAPTQKVYHALKGDGSVGDANP